MEQKELLAAAGLSESAIAKVKDMLGLDGEATANELVERAVDTTPEESVKRNSVKFQPVVLDDGLGPPPAGKFVVILKIYPIHLVEPYKYNILTHF